MRDPRLRQSPPPLFATVLARRIVVDDRLDDVSRRVGVVVVVIIIIGLDAHRGWGARLGDDGEVLCSRPPTESESKADLLGNCLASAAATIAFVYTHKLSSSTYRGQLVARALNQSYLRCGESIGDRFFDLIVHLKLPCASLLPHGRSHVIDHIDALPDRYRAFQKLLANFRGQIFNTDEHL